MRQISPGENFTITRQLGDPSDSTTNYVRAVVRWADTDAVIPFDGNNFINLTDQGSSSQRFRGTMHVPGDKNGGAGSYLTITTTVYTDSGYTTKNENYVILEEQYLVQDRRNPYQGLGGAGAQGITPGQIREAVKAVLKDQPQPKDFDTSKIMSALAEIATAVKSIDIKVPEPEKVNFQPVLDAIQTAQNALQSEVKSIVIPEPEKLDLSPVLEKLDAFKLDEYQQSANEILDRIKEFFRTDMDDIKGYFTDITKFLKTMPFVAIQKGQGIEPDSMDESDTIQAEPDDQTDA